MPECLLTYTHPIIYPKFIGSGIQNTGKPNKLLHVMTLCRHDFYIGIHAIIWLKHYPQNFCGLGT